MASATPSMPAAPAAPAQPAARSAQTFGVAAMAVVVGLEKLHRETVEREGRQKANKHLQHLCRLRNVLIPAFENRPVRELTNSELNDWMRAFKVPVRGGERGATKAPGQSTVGSFGATFNKVMREAADRNWIKLENAPRFSKRGFEASIPNASFAQAEVEALRDHMTDLWAATAHRGLSKDVKFVLRAYVALASTTGIRPGLELERIHADQIQFERDKGAPVIRIPILAHQAKYQIPRDVYVVERDVFDPRAVLLRLLAWRRERGAAPDSLLFSIPGGAVPAFSPPFKRLLREVMVPIDPDTRGGPTRPLLIDPETRLPRKPYGLRHYFATQALLRGYPDHIVAKWMGTSREMIDRHYNKVKLRMQAAHLAGTSPEHRAEFVAAALRRQGKPVPDARPLSPQEEAAIDREIAAWEVQEEEGWHPHPESEQPEIPDHLTWVDGHDYP